MSIRTSFNPMGTLGAVRLAESVVKPDSQYLEFEDIGPHTEFRAELDVEDVPYGGYILMTGSGGVYGGRDMRRVGRGNFWAIYYGQDIEGQNITATDANSSGVYSVVFGKTYVEVEHRLFTLRTTFSELPYASTVFPLRIGVYTYDNTHKIRTSGPAYTIKKVKLMDMQGSVLHDLYPLADGTGMWDMTTRKRYPFKTQP